MSAGLRSPSLEEDGGLEAFFARVSSPFSAMAGVTLRLAKARARASCALRSSLQTFRGRGAGLLVAAASVAFSSLAVRAASLASDGFHSSDSALPRGASGSPLFGEENSLAFAEAAGGGSLWSPHLDEGKRVQGRSVGGQESGKTRVVASGASALVLFFLAVATSSAVWRASVAKGGVEGTSEEAESEDEAPAVAAKTTNSPAGRGSPPSLPPPRDPTAVRRKHKERQLNATPAHSLLLSEADSCFFCCAAAGRRRRRRRRNSASETKAFPNAFLRCAAQRVGDFLISDCARGAQALEKAGAFLRESIRVANSKAQISRRLFPHSSGHPSPRGDSVSLALLFAGGHFVIPDPKLLLSFKIHLFVSRSTPSLSRLLTGRALCSLSVCLCVSQNSQGRELEGGPTPLHREARLR